MVANKVIDWIRKNKLISAIVFLSLFLRLFRIGSYMTFLGDEGRDALVWLRMLHGKFTLIGPQTSIGNMYLGPLYYYLMFPFYVLTGTVGPSIGVALSAGATTFLLWFFGKEWFSKNVGLIAAFLYAISPVAIVLSRSSWNPNVMPFFTLLIIWGVWQFWQKERFCWVAVEGVLLSIAVQSHYLGLLLTPIVSLFWIVTLVKLITNKDLRIKSFLVFSAFGVLSFVLLTILPLVWFDLRHNFINYKAFYKFFSERQTTVNFRPYKALPQIWPLWQALIIRLLAGTNAFFGYYLSIVLLIILGLTLFTNTISTKLLYRNLVFKRKSYVILFFWLIIGLLGMGLYKQHIYDHYFGFLFPAIFLLFAVILEKWWELKIYGKILAITLFSFVMAFSFLETPLKYQPNFQMKRTAEVAEKIVEESKNKPFNLGMIAKQNYDAGYRYFLEKWGYKAVEIDAQRPQQTITDQLFVICEEKVCEPTTHPQAEIANFGWSKIEKEWDFPWGVKLFKLVHNFQNE